MFFFEFFYSDQYIFAKNRAEYESHIICHHKLSRKHSDKILVSFNKILKKTVNKPKTIYNDRLLDQCAHYIEKF